MLIQHRQNLLDRVCYTILKAPDRFPSDTGMTLDRTFKELRSLGEKAFTSGTIEAEAYSQVISKALDEYRAGNQKSAIQLLQRIEGYLSGRSAELKGDV